MMLELINPDDLPIPPTYTHVIVAAGSKMVFIAGQEPEDGQGNLVGPGDLASRPVKCSPTWAGLLLREALAPGKWPRS